MLPGVADCLVGNGKKSELFCKALTLTVRLQGCSCSKASLPSYTPAAYYSSYQTVSEDTEDSTIVCSPLTVPPTAKWLSEKEKAFIQARLPPNSPRAEELNFNFREIVSSLKDLRLWMFTLIWASQSVGSQGLRFYQSTVIADLGFT